MKPKKLLKNIFISAAALSAAFIFSVQFQRLYVEEHISTVFVFAVFLISLLTDGYVYGIAASVAAMVAINFTFTYPYQAFDFIRPSNIVSAVIILAISIITSLLITKIKQHESAKTEADRERMRANLLRAVSHDLRTPLTTIYTASGMLRDSRETLSREQQDSMLQSISEDAEWLVRMVENLLSVTRIDNETMKITTVPTILDELIDSAVSKFSAQNPSVTVDVELPNEIVVVPIDSILIEQVIFNLLENAVHHAEGMTSLTLKVFTSGEHAVFEIADDGCGIDENRLNRLLAGDYEIHHDRTRDCKGFSGIGLSVCATIIKAHGGTITAKNRKGGGAVFTFALTKEDSAYDEQQV